MRMGKHKEWRKVAKKERRRKIRLKQAKERDHNLEPGSADYCDWLKEQEALENFEYEQIDAINKEENEKWLKAEIIAMERWKKLQEHKEMLRLQKLEEETRKRLEWELEQKRKKEDEEKLKQLEEENQRKQEIFMKHLERFLSGDATEPPEELLVSRETRPECEMCPFFLKTASCRFGDQCSRNHRYPGVSKVLQAVNFFSHFGLENANDHDFDIMLEYEDSDTYKEFKDFFYDVLPEFEKFGKIVQFKVCHNYEKHLRGNTYVEFSELRCAVAAYRALHTRWYGGKQLSLQFCCISSWKNAICGLQTRKRCPKGRACNFMHVFRNPNNMYNRIRENQDVERPRRTPPRYWRWSESPEVEVTRHRARSSERRDRRRREEKDRRQNSRSSERSRQGSRRNGKERGEPECEKDRRHDRHRSEREGSDRNRDDRARRDDYRSRERRRSSDITTKTNSDQSKEARYEENCHSNDGNILEKDVYGVKESSPHEINNDEESNRDRRRNRVRRRSPERSRASS